MTRHVVFGTGQIGSLVVGQLVARGVDVVGVNRNGGGTVEGVRYLGGDASDPAFTTEVCAGADVVHFCLNASNYALWSEQFPPLQRGVLAGAEAASARLVVLENLYAYGPVGGRDLVETLPAHPSSSKAATRAAMTDELLNAHADGRVEITIGRASDYFGPGVTQSALGDTVFPKAIAGKTAQVMGDPSQLHSYSYAPDVATALITLATEDAAPGQVWHLPVSETRTTRQILDHVYGLTGQRTRCMSAGRTTLRMLGLFQPAMREYLHTLYQFTDRWVVDDTKFRTAFGDTTTPMDDALAATVEWFARSTSADLQPNDPTTHHHTGRTSS